MNEVEKRRKAPSHTLTRTERTHTVRNAIFLFFFSHFWYIPSSSQKQQPQQPQQRGKNYVPQRIVYIFCIAYITGLAVSFHFDRATLFMFVSFCYCVRYTRIWVLFFFLSFHMYPLCKSMYDMSVQRLCHSTNAVTVHRCHGMRKKSLAHLLVKLRKTCDDGIEFGGR